ncbi:MAG: type II secretion system protein [Candidatus Moranbacteria bacterium]|nr:type II secretion system protein [Candidatus Moranbacteria bacterium]
MKNTKSGFTLVELLLVIGIIATLAVVVFVALDPAKRFADARDARRTSDVETILSAVHQYVIDSKGSFPAGIDNAERQIATATDTCGVSGGGCGDGGETGCVDLSGQLAKYLKEIPYDPTAGIGPDHSHYTIVKDDNGIVTVRACDAEGGVISVSR